MYHKETKTVKENDKVTTNTVVDKRNLKFGGRNVSPDKIFKADETDQTGSVEICSTGWNRGSQITPEELEECVEKIETEIECVERLESDIRRIEIDIEELKQRIIKKTV